MNANTTIDFDYLHERIAADIQAAFPQFKTVEFYRDDRKTLVTPACLLALNELDPDPQQDPGTGQTAVMAQFEAELVIGFREPAAKRLISKLAAALGAWLRQRRWSNPAGTTPAQTTGPAMVTAIVRDDFQIMNRGRNDDLPQFEVWRVEWEQLLELGPFVFADENEGDPPATVYASSPPEIGAAHEDDYDQVYPE